MDLKDISKRRVLEIHQDKMNEIAAVVPGWWRFKTARAIVLLARAVSRVISTALETNAELTAIFKRLEPLGNVKNATGRDIARAERRLDSLESGEAAVVGETARSHGRLDALESRVERLSPPTQFKASDLVSETIAASVPRVPEDQASTLPDVSTTLTPEAVEGSKMQNGNRRFGHFRLTDLRAGEYGRLPPMSGTSLFKWGVRTPEGLAFVFPSERVVEHEDGTISIQGVVTPCDSRRQWLTRGVWIRETAPAGHRWERRYKPLRSFNLRRHEDVSGVSGTGIVARGVEFPDGQVVLWWATTPGSLAVYANIENLIEIHGHDGRGRIEWEDDSAES